MAYNYEYPYTDTYRYNNDWLLNKMKELTEEFKNLRSEWSDEQEAFRELKEYVYNYFENLDLSAEVSSKLDEMVNDGTLFDLFFSKEIIIITDSYGNYPTLSTSWLSIIKPLLERNGYTVYSNHLGGAGFGVQTNKTFLELLEEVTVPDNSRIKEVVICGGYNDCPNVHGATQATINNGIADTADYIKETYPNAIFKIGFISGTSGTEVFTPYNMTTTILQYIESAALNGAVYLNNVQYIMRNDSYFIDGIHPTEAASKKLAYGVFNAIMSGCCNVQQRLTNCTVEYIDLAENSNNYFASSIDNAITTLSHYQFTPNTRYTLSESHNFTHGVVSVLRLCKLSNTFCIGQYAAHKPTPIQVYLVSDTSGLQTTAIAYIAVVDREIRLYIDVVDTITDVTTVRMSPFTLTYPTLN